MPRDDIADQDRMTQRRDCYYCTKHRTGEDAPPGGWLVAGAASAGGPRLGWRSWNTARWDVRV